MLSIQVSEYDWSIGTKYWHDLGKHLNDPDDRKKVDFLNRVIFESASLNAHNSQSAGAATTEIPSIRTLSEIMNEIDNELEKGDKKTDDANQLQAVGIKIDEKIKAFIREPV